MLRIDTLSIRRALYVLAPIAALAITGCGAATNADGGDALDDPSNATPVAVEGREGDDIGWEDALKEAETAEDTANVQPREVESTEGSEPAAAGEEGEVGTSADALTTSTSRATKLLNELNREYWSLSPYSYYSHTTYMNESTGTRRTDCSGYLDYALKRVMPDAYSLVPHPNTYKPLANDWVAYLSSRPTTASTDTSKPRWRRITKVSDLRAGDVIAWEMPESVDSENTGHVLIVRSTPTKSVRTGEWLVKIMDSTRSPHANDSRGTSETGIGTGTLGLKVDSLGKPLAYYWRGGLSYNALYTKIALGRVE
jgi:hypothetical protein